MKDDESAERGRVSKDNDQKLIITVEDQVQVLQEDKEIVRTGADQIHPIQNATSKQLPLPDRRSLPTSIRESAGWPTRPSSKRSCEN